MKKYTHVKRTEIFTLQKLQVRVFHTPVGSTGVWKSLTYGVGKVNTTSVCFYTILVGFNFF